MIEILSVMIRNSAEIRGFQLYGTEVKFSAYADDVTVFLDGTEKNVTAVCKLLDYYGGASGLKVNYKKSGILRIGPLKDTTTQFCLDKHFTWTSEGVKTLGIFFLNDETKMVELNLETRIKEMKTILQKWKRRNLTLLGKVTVIKMLALPILTYPLINLPDPTANTIKSINKELYAFLWNNKPDKIARKVVIQNIDKGGLKMTDIGSFISASKANWIKRYTNDENKGDWKINFRNHLKKVGGENFFNTSLTGKDLKKYFHKEHFVYHVLKHWSKIAEIKNSSNINVLEQAIWHNSYIKQKKDPIESTKWAKRGILQIKHIIKENQLISFNELKERHNLDAEDYFIYQRVKHSIPPLWLENIASKQTESFMEPLIREISKKIKMYKILL